MIRVHATTEQLSRMNDGMLSPGAQAHWTGHLAGCAECRSHSEAIHRVQAVLRGLPPAEINPLEQLQPPVFVPVVRPAFPWWGFTAGLAVGALLIMVFVIARPVHQPMRVVSAAGALAPGEPLSNTPLVGDIDLEIPNQISFRLKPGTTVAWQELDRLWLFGGRPNIVLNVMKGEVLARTHEQFWGSKLQVRTPTANAVVKGTAFSVKVEPMEDATTLKVLAGSVFLSPYLDRVGVEVGAGREGRVSGRKLSKETKTLSIEEKNRLLETYRIGKSPVAELVIGGGPERLDELLQPALLYLGVQTEPMIQPFVLLRVREMNQAILENRLDSAAAGLRGLETAVQQMTDPEVAVPLRLFLGAANVRMGYPRRACLHFQWVHVNAPQHPLASLALAAVGRTTERSLRNPEAAAAYFREVLERHPKSPEAQQAREFFIRIDKR